MEKVKIGQATYNLEEKDAALVKAIKELTRQLMRIANRENL